LVDGCFRVGRVGLVEVDAIGPQSPQACVARGQDVTPREPLVVGPVAVSGPGGIGYASAVSMNVTPWSYASSRIFLDVATSACPANVIVPRQIFETLSPVRPIRRCCMVRPPSRSTRRRKAPFRCRSILQRRRAEPNASATTDPPMHESLKRHTTRTSYRQRLFVEHDLGESSGSTVDVAPSWASLDCSDEP